ncbi:hypothetical protein G5V57_07390 [Nordella sp. HKS 07]|uniref:hypothetical protein n=1 Tax=Nordella sp. HKS 07 TaxID=2712222 RepID=UPI0013E140F4|nr:hypothetical protein [Nordella sp. HKS 07]QIG47570.1 hypothetical protein G5V57_07390 [Nordella sp. HKS 07]
MNNAAKDDVVGLNGDFTFTIADLLANDPGGAAKVNVTKQFFFGNTSDYDGLGANDFGVVDFAHGGIPTVAQQTAYLLAHNITANADFTEFTIGAGGSDIEYMVQIGNKGTWSQADVDVTAPVPVPHVGGNLFTENFDGYDSNVQQTYYDPADSTNAVFASVNLNNASGWTGAQNSELGADGYGGIKATSGGPDGFWLDTQNTPGQINISHDFTDSTAAVGGKTAVLSFDIAKQNLTYLGNAYQTEANASFDVRIDGVTVKTILASDLVENNQMYHFDVDIADYADNADSTHTITLVDTSPQADFTGFSIDSIQINDWVV